MSSSYLRVRRLTASLLSVALCGCVLGPTDGEHWKSAEQPLASEVAVWVPEGMKNQDYTVECYFDFFGFGPGWFTTGWLAPSGKSQMRDGTTWYEFLINPSLDPYGVVYPLCWQWNPGSSPGYKYLRTKLRVLNEADWVLIHFGAGWLNCSAQYGYNAWDTIEHCSVGNEVWVYADDWEADE